MPRFHIDAAARGTVARSAAAAIVLLCAGCSANRYEMEMSVEGDVLHRRLVCWREAGHEDPPKLEEMPDGELERIASAYGMEPPENSEQKFEFSGSFAGSMPDDIGGAGRLTTYESDMGQTWIYVERFRGEDKLTVTWEAQQEAVDELAEALITWIDAELEDSPDLDAARAFVQGPLRTDLENIVAYVWLGSAVGETSQDESPRFGFELLVRLTQFLFERGYFAPTELPEFFEVVESPDGTELLAFVRKALQSKLGPDVAVDDWKFLQDAESLKQSINDGLQDFAPFEAHRDAWLQENPEDDAESAPEPADYLSDTVQRAIGLNEHPFDSLTVTLHCPVRPYRTNGHWSDDESTVGWEAQITPHEAESPQRVLPAVLFALWSVPDIEVQTARLGRVALVDEKLARYAMWYSTLPPREVAEWDAFVSDLQPTGDLQTEIENFRFTSDPPEDPDGNTTRLVRSKQGRELLLSGLNDDE